MLAFRNGARPQLYDKVVLETALKQTSFSHLFHLDIMCFIQAGAAKEFLAVLSFPGLGRQ